METEFKSGDVVFFNSTADHHSIKYGTKFLVKEYTDDTKDYINIFRIDYIDQEYESHIEIMTEPKFLTTLELIDEK